MNDTTVKTTTPAKPASSEKKRILPDLSAQAKADAARIAELEAALMAEKAKKTEGFGIRISDKGCVVINLGGGYPISLYRNKLAMLVANFDNVKEFLADNYGKIRTNPGE